MGHLRTTESDASPAAAERGLTAIELAVVIAILAVLSAIAAIGVRGMNQSAIDIARLSDVAEVQKAVDRWVGEHPGSRYPVATPVIVDFANNVTLSATPAPNGLPQKGSAQYSRMAFTDTFTSPEGITKSFVPDSIQRLPKYGSDKPVPWLIDENGTVKLMSIARVTPTTAALIPIPPSTPTATSAPTPTSTASITATIIGTATLPATPRRIAVNGSTNRAYVAVGNSWNPATYYVSVIVGTANTVNIPVGAGDYSTGPIHVAVNDATNRVYVAHTGSNFADAINADTNAIIGRIATGAYPEGIVTNPLTNRLYIANTNSGNVSVFDTTNDANMLLTTIGIPGSGAGITNLYLAINPVTSLIYVSAPGLNKVFVIDSSSNAVVQTFPVTLSASGAIVANPATNRLYIASGNTGIVNVIDAGTGSSIATVSVGNNALGYLAVNTTLNRIYAMSYSSSILAFVDGASNGLIGTVDVGAIAHSIAADASNGRLYVGTAANTVVVFDD